MYGKVCYNKYRKKGVLVMKRITVTIDGTTEIYMNVIIDALGMSKSELIRRAVDDFYWKQKKIWPAGIEASIEKLKKG